MSTRAPSAPAEQDTAERTAAAPCPVPHLRTVARAAGLTHVSEIIPDVVTRLLTGIPADSDDIGTF